MAKNAQRPKIIGLSHMTFQSSSVEKALAYYRDLHGYEEQLCLKSPDGGISRAFVMINDAQWVELQPERAPKTDRLIQFGFQVEDAETIRTYLASRGVAVPDSISRGATGNLGFLVKDPDGHQVELVQCLADGWPARAAGRGPGPRALSRCLMHMGFDVFSMEKSMAFYRDILGCVELWRGSSDERTLSWVQLKLPDDRNYIEFMLYDETPTLERLGVFNHFGLEVPSIPAVMEEVAGRMKGSPWFPRRVEYSVGKCRHRLANVFDPDGTRAEFMERGTFDGSVTPPAAVPAPR
ncbi:MAG: VOC family protein [Spirochaetes bacterium]|nr:VOC family protein [Spirochaetota bacterium]